MTKVLSLGALVFGGLFAAGCGGGGESEVEACEGMTFPSVRASGPTPFFVSAACPAAGADGTREHPFKTISEAIEKSTAGGAIVVSSHVYAENLLIDHDLTILGAASPETKGEDAGIILQAPEPDAIKATGGTVLLVGFQVIGATGVGVFASGAKVTLASSKIDHTTTANGTAYGVAAVDDGAIILQDVGIARSELIGAYVSGAEASFSQTAFDKNAGGGIRIEGGKGDVRIESCLFQDNGLFGVAVLSSSATLVQNQILRTQGDRNAEFGAGLVAGYLAGSTVAATVDAEANTIADNDQVGILMSGGAHGIILQNNHVTGNGKGAGFGGGIWLQGGTAEASSSKIFKNQVLDNAFLGIGCANETNGIRIDTNTVTGTKMGTFFAGATEGHVGDGLTLLAGASAYVVKNHFSSSARHGVVLDAEAGQATTFDGNYIQDNDEYGIILQDQGEMPVIKSNNNVDRNGAGKTATPTGSDKVDIIPIPTKTVP